MEPIISPWIIYIINLSHYMKGLSAILTVVFGFLFLGLFLVHKTASRDDLSEGEVKALKVVGDYSKLSGVLCIAFVILGLVLPSSRTGIQMLIAYYATENNMEHIIRITGLFKGESAEDIERAIEELNKRIKYK